MSKITRREFTTGLLAAAAVTGAPAVIAARQSTKRLPIAFSTLGCPKWSWKTILEQAAANGYAAIELRGIQGEMDLTKRPEFGAAQIKTSMKDLAALNLR